MELRPNGTSVQNALCQDTAPGGLLSETVIGEDDLSDVAGGIPSSTRRSAIYLGATIRRIQASERRRKK